MKKILLGLLAFSAFSASAQIPTDGLLMHYNFNGNFNDISGNGFDATSTSGMEFVDNTTSLNDFDSITNYVYTNSKVQFDYTGNESLFETQEFTCHARIKLDGLDSYNNIFELGDYSVGGIFFFRLNFNNNILLLQAGNATQGQETSSSYNYTFNPVGTTIDFTLVTTLSGNTRYFGIYLDGVLVKSESLPFGQIQWGSVKKLNVGCRDEGGVTSLSMYGKMDEFILYNRGLVSGELNQLWQECKYANVINNDGTVLSGCPMPQLEYQWINCATGAAIPGATTKDYIPTVTAEYAVITTFPLGPNNNCDADTSTCELFTVTSGGGGVGLNESTFANTQIFPNPTTDFVTVSDCPIGTMITLMDASGRIIHSNRIELNATTIDVSNQESGMYFITLKDLAGNSTTTKLIVRK